MPFIHTHTHIYIYICILSSVPAVLVAVSIVVFGVKGHDDLGLNIDGRNRFDWGMWMGVAGFGIALCTAIVFLIQGSRI